MMTVAESVPASRPQIIITDLRRIDAASQTNWATRCERGDRPRRWCRTNSA
jgi:hypothetical protein